jgi:hypothetical protein
MDAAAGGERLGHLVLNQVFVNCLHVRVQRLTL